MWKNWAIMMLPMDRKIACPALLSTIPRGLTRFEIFLLTPSLFSESSILTGREIAEDVVVAATRVMFPSFAANLKGLTLT